MTHFPLMRKEKYCKLVLLSIKVGKFCPILRLVKTWVRICIWIGIVLMPIRIWIGIKTESRIRIGINTMPIYNTALLEAKIPHLKVDSEL